MCSRARRPVVLFAHSTGIERVAQIVHGVMAMSPGMVPDTRAPTLVFPHPARTPERLCEREVLRARFELPPEGRIIGTCGFLKFERQLVEVLSALLSYAAESGWLIQLITSPWYIESPGLLDEIGALGRRYPGHLKHVHGHLADAELNLRLQVCDLLWCWTAARSSHYASGVASDLYASGSRVVAADKIQHEHILRLPNVVRAPASLAMFVEELVGQIRRSDGERHDPSPVSWTRQSRGIARFLSEVSLRASSREGEESGAVRALRAAEEHRG